MNSLLIKLSSLKIMVAGLFWLFVLTFLGTVAQTDMGLYAAQEKYFYSWFFTLGFLPVPGARFVLWVLFINLLATTITRFSKYRKKRHWGLILIHLGMLLYFISAGVTFHAMEESNVHLLEKAGTNLSASYVDWEISFWPAQSNAVRDVVGIKTQGLKAGDQVNVAPLGLTIHVEKYLPNALAFQQPEKSDGYLSAVNITRFEPMPLSIQHEENIAGIKFRLDGQGLNQGIRLYGTEEKSLVLPINGVDYNIQLRRQQFLLPFMITLEDFRAEFHPGTEMARSYESDVVIDADGVKRKARISMNEPLRYKDFTVFQAAYAIDEMGREYSTFAVVKNVGRMLPYVSSFVVFGGLLLHFITMALTRKKYV